MRLRRHLHPTADSKQEAKPLYTDKASSSVGEIISCMLETHVDVTFDDGRTIQYL